MLRCFDGAVHWVREYGEVRARVRAGVPVVVDGAANDNQGQTRRNEEGKQNHPTQSIEVSDDAHVRI